MSNFLSDEINNNLVKSEIDGGVWLTMPEESASVAYAEAKQKGNVLQVGKVLLVQTKNTLYRIEKRGEGEFYISGHHQFCPEPMKANIHGSTFGGSMLKMDWVGRGMHLEFSLLDGVFGSITTSAIQEVTEEK